MHANLACRDVAFAMYKADKKPTLAESVLLTNNPLSHDRLVNRAPAAKFVARLMHALVVCELEKETARSCRDYGQLTSLQP